MRSIFRFTLAVLVAVTILQLNAWQKIEACGPSYLEPVFDYTYAPERPWTDFAGGKLGIVKPTYRRAVLFAAYRYLNGGGFSANEQKELVDTWEMQFNRKEVDQPGVSEAVKAWLRERKSVAGDEKVPEIYTERPYGDNYEFFPNCSKNAFEVAAKTLADRSLNYGSDSKDVKEWVNGQDKVFSNCAKENAKLDGLGAEAPLWLRKDRDYQMAAAAFYATSYDDARERFEKIAQDDESPWHEVSDYLVARTLVRRASMGSDDEIPNKSYSEAEEYLEKLMYRATTYQNDARRLMNLVKYRLHPEQRLRELALRLPAQGDSAELRQDLIDYTWLLDQFESEALKKEEERKEKESPKNTANTSSSLGANAPAVRPETPHIQYPDAVNSAPPANVPDREAALRAMINASSANAIAAPANTVVGLTGELAMSNKAPMNTAINYYPPSSYNGGYYGSEELSLSMLPPFLGDDPLTEWIFTYQIQTDDAYFHSFNRWRQTGADMWLMTAMTKAKRNLGGVKELMEAAKFASPASVAYHTIAYHYVRLLLDQGNKDEARKTLDKILLASDDVPISTRNLFLEQRMKVSQTLSDFLQSALRKPFGFAYDFDTAETLDDIIAERKSWYNPEYSEGSQAEYDLGVEKEFATKKAWQDRLFLDDDAVDIINEHFSTAQMIDVLNNPAFPDYLKRRMTIVIWTRAYLLKDEKTALAFAPAVVKFKPEIAALMRAYVNARNFNERDTTGLYLLLKTGEMTPYLQSGFDYEPPDEEDSFFQDDRWWCESYDNKYDDQGNEVPKAAFVPPFLTRQMLDAARIQTKALKQTADGVSYLSGRVMDWTKIGGADPRLAESLYIIFHANRWVKYSCGNYSEESRNEASELLKKRFPRSKWTAKMLAELKEEN